MTQIDDEKKIRLEIAKSIFKEVLDADLHQGEKATRLLIPVTFLMVAAVTLFTFFLEHKISAIWCGIDFIPILFLLYFFCTLIGILIFLVLTGPNFYEKKWPSLEERPRGPKSILFFEYISENDVKKWKDFFYKEKAENPKEYLEIDELQDKLLHDYIVESYQLAKKAHGKVKGNKIENLFFCLSFCSFFLMVYSGIINYFSAWNWFTKFFVIVILIIFGSVELKIIEKYIKKRKKEKVKNSKVE